MKAVFKMEVSCGRMGDLDGIFISTVEKVDFLIDSDIEVYFGEVLGKHSEIFGAMEKGDIELISFDPKVVGVVEQFKLSTGFNPMDEQTINCGEDDEYDDWTVEEVIVDMMKKGDV